MSEFNEAVIFLSAAVIAVPIFKRLGFGAILGYLSAGICIGPYALNLISDVDNILHFAELGVVLLLFIIGLELQPSRLWTLRHSIFVWGTIQMLATTLVFALLGLIFGLSLAVAILTGFTLSLSSTAFALQMLAERHELTTRHGRTAFSILLFQDIAVVPVLAILPLLAMNKPETAAPFAWMPIMTGTAIILIILFAGRLLLRYFLGAVARTEIREILTAATLLIVVGIGIILEHIGLSMAMGAFIAGVLLADSEYRHQLETDIAPFKGLLLGLFFMAVGMSVNLSLIQNTPGQVILATLLLISVKGVLLFILGKLQGLNTRAAKNLALSISQGGEFAFVVFASAVSIGLLETSLSDILIVAVTLSMAITPLLLKMDDYLSSLQTRPEREFDTLDEEHNQVIIAGFGRFGQITGRLLSAKKIPFTALEINPDQVDFVRKFGNQVFYGDASRLDLLRSAHADKASIFVLAIDDVEASVKTAGIVKHYFPNLTIYARARNRQHAYQLMELGVTLLRRETFASALEIAGLVLSGLGLSEAEVKLAVNRFKEYDVKRLHENLTFHTDEEKLIALSKSAAKELEELFAADKNK